MDQQQKVLSFHKFVNEDIDWYIQLINHNLQDRGIGGHAMNWHLKHWNAWNKSLWCIMVEWRWIWASCSICTAISMLSIHVLAHIHLPMELQPQFTLAQEECFFSSFPFGKRVNNLKKWLQAYDLLARLHNFLYLVKICLMHYANYKTFKVNY